MNRPALALALLTALALPLLPAAAVFACTVPAPGVTRTLVHPPRDATGIPRNTEIRIRFQETPTAGLLDVMAPPELHDALGQKVEATVEKLTDHRGTVYVLRPAAPLAADASYTVLDDMGTTEDFASAMGQAPQPGQVVAGTFTTGAALDEVAPDFGGLTGFGTGWDSCDNSACCGPYAGYKVVLQWTPATDATPNDLVTYHVYRNGIQRERIGSFLTLATGAAGGGGGYLAWASTLGKLPDGDYEACAVDLAGHESCGAGYKHFAKPADPEPDPEPDASDTSSPEPDDASDTSSPEPDDASADVAPPLDATQADGIGGTDASSGGTKTSEGSDSGCTASPRGTSGAAVLLGLLIAIVWRRRTATAVVNRPG